MAAGLRYGRSLYQYQHGSSIDVSTESQLGQHLGAGLWQRESVNEDLAEQSGLAFTWPFCASTQFCTFETPTGLKSCFGLGKAQRLQVASKQGLTDSGNYPHCEADGGSPTPARFARFFTLSSELNSPTIAEKGA
jgi:hypothetical protein